MTGLDLGVDEGLGAAPPGQQCVREVEHIPSKQTLHPGPWTLDAGLWTLDSGPWTLDPGPWTLDPGPWTSHVLRVSNLLLQGYLTYNKTQPPRTLP